PAVFTRDHYIMRSYTAKSTGHFRRHTAAVMTCSQRMVAVKVRFAVTLPRSASSCDGRVRNPVIVCLQTLLAAWGIAATNHKKASNQIENLKKKEEAVPFFQSVTLPKECTSVKQCYLELAKLVRNLEKWILTSSSLQMEWSLGPKHGTSSTPQM
ncbi:hypothetical protein HID58_072375, partial [Brassica napus]